VRFRDPAVPSNTQTPPTPTLPPGRRHADPGQPRKTVDPHYLSRLADSIRRYGVLSLPSTFFVDKDGVIRHLELTAMSEAQIRNGIRKAR